MNLKLCKKCGIEKPATEEYFPKSKSCKDGLEGTCRICAAERSKQWYASNTAKALARVKQYGSDNANKISEYGKQWRENNKEYVPAYNKQYRIKNSEYIKHYKKSKAEQYRCYVQRRDAIKRKLPSTFTVHQWEDCKNYFNNRCAYCGKAETLTQEHVIPLSSGGGYAKENIIPACGKCNYKKQDKEFILWYRLQPFYSKERENSIINYLTQTTNEKKEVTA